MKYIFVFAALLFMSNVQAAIPAVVTIDAVVAAVSPLPDPEINDYADCLYTARVNMRRFKGETATFPASCIVVLPILDDYKLIEKNILKPGDVITCSVIPFDDVPEDISHIQLSDQFADLDSFYGYTAAVTRGSVESPGNWSDKLDSNARKNDSHTVATLERTPGALQQRQTSIADNLKKADQIIAAHGGIDAWKKNNKQYLGNLDKAVAENAAGWFGNSYFAAAPVNPDYDNYRIEGSFLESITEYKEFLDTLNIDLVLVRIPSKGDVSFDLFSGVPDNDFYQPEWMEVYRRLLAHDIEIIDTLPAIIAKRSEYPLLYFYHIPQEGHPLAVSYIVAEEIAKVLARYNIPKDETFSPVWKNVAYSNTRPRSFYPEGNDKFPHTEQIIFKGVFEEKNRMHTERASGSPFIFLSDSYGAFPDLTKGGSIPQALSAELGVRCDWLYRNGYSATALSELVKRHTDLLNNRKAVIMLMSPGTWRGIVPFKKPIAQRLTLEKQYEFTTIHPELGFRPPEAFTQDTDAGVLVANIRNRPVGIVIPLDKRLKGQELILRIHFVKHGTAAIAVDVGESRSAGQLAANDPVEFIDIITPTITTGELSILLTRPSANAAPMTISAIEFYSAE